LTGQKFRLPTEEEWEYAARGGRYSNGYKYSGSNYIGEVAWYFDNSGMETHTVGTKSPNELGLYDLSGNVWEWTSSHYSDNYNSPRNSSNFVNRGGCCGDDARYCRVSNCDNDGRTRRNSGLGLRLALDN
ncbi:MAG: formylglycine-generating enzyme family protein, partial [Muribaculaceae bacterium]|nr:formylglycine-generating enzyme family protein [Muribaculaceae bacterium]